MIWTWHTHLNTSWFHTDFPEKNVNWPFPQDSTGNQCRIYRIRQPYLIRMWGLSPGFYFLPRHFLLLRKTQKLLLRMQGPLNLLQLGTWGYYLDQSEYFWIRALVMSSGMLRRDISCRFIIIIIIITSKFDYVGSWNKISLAQMLFLVPTKGFTL